MCIMCKQYIMKTMVMEVWKWGTNCQRLFYRARQLYKNISLLFLFPVRDGKFSTGVIAIFNASCYG